MTTTPRSDESQSSVTEYLEHYDQTTQEHHLEFHVHEGATETQTQQSQECKEEAYHLGEMKASGILSQERNSIQASRKRIRPQPIDHEQCHERHLPEKRESVTSLTKEEDQWQ